MIQHAQQTCFALLITVLACTQVLLGQNELQSIEVTEAGQVTFKFEREPLIAQSALSTQKTQISLRIPDCEVNQNASSVAGGGAVERIFVQRDEGDAMVYIELRERSGYSLLILPYSAAVRLNVVDWMNMSAAEEHFHSGLLAMESGAHSAAQYEFEQAEKHPDAKAMLGLIHMRNGAQDEAQQHLRDAVRLKSSVADAYAALSQIESALGNAERADDLAQTFFRLSKRDTIPPLPSRIPASSPQFDEPQTLAASIVAPGRDSVFSAIPDSSLQEVVATDSNTNQASAPALALSASDTAGTGPSEFAQKYGNPREMRSKELKSLMPEWIKWTAAGLALFAVFGGIGVGVFYWRWRKKKLGNKPAAAAGGDFEAMVREALENEEPQEDVPQEAASETPPAAQDRSPYAPKFDDAAQPEDFELKNDMPESTLAQDKEADVEIDEDWLAALDDDSPVSTFSAAHAPAETDTFANPGLSEEAQRETVKTMQSSGAALHMAQKLGRSRMQARITQLEDVEADDIPQGRQDRAAMARSLGITAGELQIKQSLGRLQNTDDAEELDKLASIFSTQAGSNLKNS